MLKINTYVKEIVEPGDKATYYRWCSPSWQHWQTGNRGGERAVHECLTSFLGETPGIRRNLILKLGDAQNVAIEKLHFAWPDSHARGAGQVRLSEAMIDILVMPSASISGWSSSPRVAPRASPVPPIALPPEKATLCLILRCSSASAWSPTTLPAAVSTPGLKIMRRDNFRLAS